LRTEPRDAQFRFHNDLVNGALLERISLMMTGKLLVANRGEITTRICRAAAELDLATVAVYPADDASSLHTRKADEAIELPGRGVAAYMDGAEIIAAARKTKATAIHPGYGFLSENASFARACAEAGIVFVGPTPENLELFGNKHAARELARRHDVPTLTGTAAPTSLADCRAFLEDLGPDGAVMVKAVAGGGGRGMRPVLSADELDEAYARCQSEALAGFGNGDLYVERLVRSARHIEVQIIGDGHHVSHLWERDCSLQRRRQKIIELAPARDLDPGLRDRLIDAALRLADAVNYQNLGTVEFLVDTDSCEFFFIEANPRLQVEHTVTEEITGLDLVELQLRLAGGATLAELGLSRDAVPQPRGTAIQLRINAERMTPEGDVKPAGGTISAFEPPSGRGIRVDSYGYVGYTTNPAYDTLLAKLITHTIATKPTDIFTKAYRALCEFQIAGVPTNIEFLQALLRHEAVRDGAVDTGFVEANAAPLAGSTHHDHPSYFFKRPHTRTTTPGAGARIDSSDPLAVIAYGQSQQSANSTRPRRETDPRDDSGPAAVRSPIQGTIVSIAVEEGDRVAKGAQLAVIEAMKMEHLVTAQTAGTVGTVHVAPGDTLWEDQLMMGFDPGENSEVETAIDSELDLDEIRTDLAEVLERRALTTDERRPHAVERRRKTNRRTAHENVADLVDPGTFVEYGPLIVAAQRLRRDREDLLTRSPADGLVAGVGSVNGELFDDPTARAAVLAYDYTVFAGTQGVHNHWKTDRLIDVAERGRMPLVLFGEGGGGRPGETDYGGFVGQTTFSHFGQLSGLVPMIAIVTGRCFAGNAALVGCCDVVIATDDTNLGMGGPAMIEGGGLGVFKPEEIGAMADQVPNGVVDIPVADEAEAVAVAKKYLGYFQGRLTDWTAPDQRRMRHIVPENRLRVYEVRDVIETLADEGSILELRKAFGRTIVTALIRIEGRAVGIVANDPKFLGGATDSDGGDKAARFMQLLDAFDIPLVHLCDTPGFMVGPEAEKTGLVRHVSRMFLTGNNLTIPFFTIILRKAYGLGAIAMAGGNFRAPLFTVSWPTGEFGPMGLEGQVKLGYRAELAAIEDPEERRKFYEQMVAKSYEEGKALARSETFSFDDVIDPSETRHWLASLLAGIRPPAPRDGKKRPMVDAW
jgi:acetyl/propionyl-CoA carboxylase alpha subunit/acetyl-CoA carboxylase carboxyltransferase component